MIRVLVILALTLSLAIVSRGAIQGFTRVELPEAPPARSRKAPLPKLPNLKEFYPPVAVVLPDLSDGYLFNAERILVAEGEEPAAEETPQPVAGAQVDMESLEYVGSIIVGSLRKGMVAYTVLEEKPAKPAPQRRFPGRRRTKIPVKKAKKAETSRKYATVKEHDEFHGYLVAEVAPDHIVFTRGTERVEKLLYDPEKERLAPPAAAVRRQPTAGKRPATAKAPQPARSAAPAAKPRVAPRQQPVSPVARRAVNQPRPPVQPNQRRPPAVIQRRHPR